MQRLPSEEDETPFAGLHVRDLTNALAERYGYEGEQGVIIIEVEATQPRGKSTD